jgi:hypothetical protein
MLLQAAYKTVREIMSIYLKKDVMPGAMCVLHNFGRDLKKNCHIHMLVTEGGKYLEEWLQFTYFPFVKKGRVHTTINELWRDNVLAILTATLEQTDINRRFIEGFRKRYDFGFYIFGDSDSRVKCNRSAYSKAKYITRYVKHPPISNSRILSYDEKTVTFWYERPSTKKRTYITMPTMEFIKNVIIHLPEKGFNMIVYYGLYSPRYIPKPIVQTIFPVGVSTSKKVIDPKTLSWRQKMIMQNNVDPLCCLECNNIMVFVCLVCKGRNGYSIIHKLMKEDEWAINYPNENEFVAGLA